MALIRWFVIVSVFSLACGNFILDPGRDPVLQRLEIPAQPSDFPSGSQQQQHQQSLKKSRGIPNVVVEAEQPFSLTLPRDSVPSHVVTHHKVSGRDGKPLPPWILYDPVSRTLHGQPSASDAGGWTVQVDDVTADDRQLIRDVFTIQVVVPGSSASSNPPPTTTNSSKFISSNDKVRSKRQSDQDAVDPAEGSGGDEEEYDDDYATDGSEENFVPDDRVVPALASPVFEVSSATPVVKSAAAPSSSETVGSPSSIIPVIRPTKLSGPPVTDVVVEATPVLVQEAASSASLLPSSVAFDDGGDDYDRANFSRGFEPAEPTPAEATPPLPDDVVSLIPNLIDDYDDAKKNQPPQVKKRLQRITATAGKVFRFQIPAETFSNGDDGDTRTLELDVMPADGKQLEEFVWIGFDQEKQVIYGLPLADDMGKYVFTVQARNANNLTASEQAEILVRQHSAERAFHHRFTLQLEPEFSTEEMQFPQAYWMLKTVGGLSRVLGDKEDNIVVRSIGGNFRNNDAFTLSWSNESLARTFCPEDEIQEIFELLYNKEADEVTPSLEEELSPQLSVTLGSIELDGICQQMPTTPPTPAEVPGKKSGKMNSAPTVRNQVDHLDAQVGVLFRQQVPEDAFYDEEDGGTRRLNLVLMTINHQPLNPSSWLQFDVPNQEFYGVPLDSDVGSEEYQLVCTDSAGLKASDGLVVAVKERPKNEAPMVEFVIVIDVEYEALANSAHRKARLVEALARLFEDPDPRNVVIRSFEAGPPTVVRWHNASLVKCSDEEITQLRRYLIDDDSKLTSRCKDTLSSADFIPQSASLVPLGSCSSAFTPTHGPETDVSVDGVEEKGAAAPADASWSDDYLLTFIVPGIIITLMLLLAAVIACVLYRRRRTGKLGLEERRGFVSKGIPIIFAEELEERPSGRHPAKAPVILKEEKPSQPPDYHKIRSSTSPYPAHKASTTSSEQRDLLRTPSEDVDDEQASLYQPPPPVSANRESSRYSRPKATPAYRKPPPYVPP